MLVLAGALLLGLPTAAQQRRHPRQGNDFTLTVDVDLVVLHTTVVDKRGRLINNLQSEHFKIYEDNVEQKLAVFRNEEVPVTTGLVLDNSSSMKDNRRAMMAGALRFVETSNSRDEIFVVNFNEDYYLDLQDQDFTNEIEKLKEALEKTNTRGGTAFYDAVRASLEHLKRGTVQKKVLLIISDGVDHVSVSDFDTLLRDAQRADAALYFVGLPCAEEKRDCRKAKRQMRKLASVTGGMAYFPTSIEQVEALCKQIARDIRSQYVLGYYPTNRARDGSFRRVQVRVNPPKGHKKLFPRTRPGYYAPSEDRAGSQ
ncbi:MAG: VWA domain-containing protein [Terriglobia bacterium]